MIKVTLKAGYQELEFIFPDMVEAAGFMSAAMRNSVDANFKCETEQYSVQPLPEGFEEME